jgi:hypothetical protein
MLSTVVPLAAVLDRDAVPAAARRGAGDGAGTAFPEAAPEAAFDAAAWCDADLVLAFLPPCDDLPGVLGALGESFPAARIAGCETVTQFAGDRLATDGTLHLVRFTGAGAGVEAHAFGADAGDDDLAPLADHLAAGRPALFFADGLRCPVDGFLARLRRRLARRPPAPPPMAGGLASQPQPVVGLGARAFLDGEVSEAGCVAVLLSGVEATIEVVRGWDPASPVYGVTRAEGHVLFEIDGESAAAWFRRFFTVGGVLAPLPETAHRFPLIVVGPDPARCGLYRSMRSFDDPPGAVTFWGDLAEGDRVRLGMGNEESLVARAGDLAGMRDTPPPEAAVLYSCVGREVVLGDAAEREVAAVHRALGGAPLSGFFSFGEIGPTPTGGPAFYNHTAILVLLSETAGGAADAAGAEGAA